MATETDLFAEFEPTSSEEWKAKVLQDLKGKPWEKLVWQAEEGIKLAPFYRREELNYTAGGIDGMPGAFPFRRGNSFNTQEAGWQVVEQLEAQEAGWEERLAEAKAVGVHAISLRGIQDGSLWDYISWSDTALHLQTILEPAMLSLDLYTSMRSQGVKAELLTGTLVNDPIARFAAQGKAMPIEEFTEIEAGVLNFKQSPWFRGVGLDGRYVHEQGGTASQEIAYVLASLVEYIDLLEQTESQIELKDLLANVAVYFSVGTHFFVELAKFRAFRMLYAVVIKAYGIEDPALQSPFIVAETDHFHQTSYDVYNNLLRTTTGALSAVFGGAQAIMVAPFDRLLAAQNARSQRLARNIQHLLIHEAYLDKVIDPAGGSYYVEQMTQQIAEKSWSLFQHIEEGGGFLELAAKGDIGEMICTAAGEKLAKLAHGKQQVVGVNFSPNTAEVAAEALGQDGRLTAGYEAFRSQLDVQGAARGKRYTVGFFLFGDVKMRQARAQFSRNVLGSGGFEVHEYTDLDQLLEAKPDHVVLCAADVDYVAQAATISSQLKAQLRDARVMIAGRLADWEALGADGILYAGMDVRTFLMELKPQS